MRSRRQANPIDVVEAAYELERDDEDWLRNLADVVRPLVDGGRGLVAYHFDMARPKPFPDHPLLLGMDPRDWEFMRRLTTSSARFVEMTKIVHVYPQSYGTLLDEGRRAGLGDLREDREAAGLFRYGIGDAVSLRTIEPGGKGVAFAGPHHAEHRIDKRAVRLWARVAAHIAAGRRLRAAHDDVEAVLHPSGRVDDACAEASPKSARQVLRAAVLRQEKARGRARRADPEAATQAWSALVGGRWSLVDRFERGGRRFIVARRNTHALPDPRALTGRERAAAHLAALGKSNKLIAYELGLAESTVATHVASAVRKLGATSRVELVRLVGSLGHNG